MLCIMCERVPAPYFSSLSCGGWAWSQGYSLGLLTSVFVACSTDIGEGLVKFLMCSGVPGCLVDAWRSVHSWITSMTVEISTFMITMCSDDSMDWLLLAKIWPGVVNCALETAWTYITANNGYCGEWMMLTNDALVQTRVHPGVNLKHERSFFHECRNT